MSDDAPLDYGDGDRNYFVKRVLFIVLIMLCITLGFTYTVLAVDDLRRVFARFRFFILIGCFILEIAMSYAMHGSRCSRVPPTNYICLILVLIIQSLICAAVTSIYKTHIVIHALAVTILVVAVCVVLACTSIDFTKWYLIVIAIGTTFCALSLILFISSFFFGLYSKPLHMVILIGLTLVSVVTLILELQMVLGGRAIELSETDYALGAYMLYTSIIDIFLLIARLLVMTMNDGFDFD